MEIKLQWKNGRTRELTDMKGELRVLYWAYKFVRLNFEFIKYRRWEKTFELFEWCEMVWALATFEFEDLPSKHGWDLSLFWEEFTRIKDRWRGSPTFGDWFGTTLDDENMRMMYVPPGFAHGFVVLSETADFIYKCTDYYHPESEQGILWNDPDIGIQWPMIDIQLSDKDKNNMVLKNQPENLLTSFTEEVQ